jgi:prepilin-type N-terminal cleavage/methylation domain-containing protein
MEMRRIRGFTLVELLVVIAIISILTVITVSQFETARKKARDAQRKGDVGSVAKALQLYFADYNVFPSANTVNGWLMTGGEFKDAADYVYMKVMPKETRPLFPPFCYKTDMEKKKFAVYALLENTADSDCHYTGGSPSYGCEGQLYCFAVTSPNATLDGSGNLN